MIKKLIARIKLRRQIKIEMLETLASICLYLECEGRRTHNREAQYMHSHFYELKRMSQELREEATK